MKITRILPFHCVQNSSTESSPRVVSLDKTLRKPVERISLGQANFVEVSLETRSTLSVRSILNLKFITFSISGQLILRSKCVLKIRESIFITYKKIY